MTTSLKQYSLVAGDLITLYGSLLITLLLRYHTVNAYLWHAHAGPFTIIFLVWIVLFYIAGLYDLKNLKNTIQLITQILVTVGIGAGVAIALFYLIPYFKISPKTNLLIFSLLFVLLETWWRWLFTAWTKKPEKRLLLIGSGHDIEELSHYIAENPQLGYEIPIRIESVTEDTAPSLPELIQEHRIDTLVISESIEDHDSLLGVMYEYVLRGIETFGVVHLYESVLQKLPVESTERLWVLTNVTHGSRIYDMIKSPLEYIGAFILLVLLLPLMIIIGIFVAVTSRGPVLYSQQRVGYKGKLFSIYKFRTMFVSAEETGPQWAQPHDARITPIGAILRASHLDELPQLVNVLKREVSFVGPRPERPEFVSDLKQTIPYYEVRHTIKPGITGWAQINYRYGASNEDAYHKLQYDLFYIKNRTLILDILIILKTIKLFFTTVK
ncbi:MAG: exopolysaccharide biosynthesis polyprenyl glycosylphosphotransferase [Patescibacteria group bacterium]|nr:exopolysaccharide biosynthesis polyprenyl glycosylphosphotransferase [Patescibacteria group bacterium]MDE2438251.1 exopolysaccharide biosynthesis polyprenyl glycosylphosphotransferase [Patescibacteria group bacterium]